MRWLIEAGHLIVSLIPTPPPVVEAKPKAKIAKGRPIQSRGFATPDVPVKIASRGFDRTASRGFDGKVKARKVARADAGAPVAVGEGA
jgi:hypothetical protein